MEEDDDIVIRYRFKGLTDPCNSGKRKGTNKTEWSYRRLWSMLFADDAAVVKRSPGTLQRLMDVLVTTCSEFGLLVSVKKTETMAQCLPAGVERETLQIRAFNGTLKQVEVFVYLGGAVTSDASIQKELRLALWRVMRYLLCLQ